MRVSNNQLLGSSVQAMQKQGADALKYQQQIASGNRYAKASEAPVELARGVAIQFEQKRQELLKSNQNVVQLRMDVGYIQLDTMSQLAFTLKEMAARAAFPGLDATSLQALYQEAVVVGDALRQAANATDASGRRLISLTEPPSVEVESGVSLPTEVWFGNDAVMGLDLPTQIDRIDDFVEALGGLTAPYNPNLPPEDPPNPNDTFKAAIVEFDKALDRILVVRTQTGSLSAQVDDARDSVQAKDIQLEAARARLLETDIAEASTKLVRAQTLLQAAQSIFARLEASNLFQRLT